MGTACPDFPRRHGHKAWGNPGQAALQGTGWGLAGSWHRRQAGGREGAAAELG